MVTLPSRLDLPSHPAGLFLLVAKPAQRSTLLVSVKVAGWFAAFKTGKYLTHVFSGAFRAPDPASLPSVSRVRFFSGRILPMFLQRSLT